MREKKNVLIITGSRAEFGLLESTILRMAKSKLLKPTVFVTGMHSLKTFGNTFSIILGGYKIIQHNVSQNGSMLSWLSEEIIGIQNYCLSNKVDCIVVLGDRDEPFAGAIVGAHLGIPVAHIHGGDLSGWENVDNKLRNAITQLSDFHFTASKKSYSRVKKLLGKAFNVGGLFQVGAPGIDLLQRTPFKEVKKHKVIVIMHPSPLDKTPIKKQIKCVYDAVKNMDYLWIYPNSDTGSETFLRYLPKSAVANIKRDDYINYMRTADVMVGNSSSGILEAWYFNLPVVNVGSRQKGRERAGIVLDVPYNTKEIKSAILRAPKIKNKKIQVIYGNGTAGKKIVKSLERLL